MTNLGTPTAVIGLGGFKGVGKDTVAGYIEEYAKELGYTTYRSWWAKAMKESIAALLRIPLEQIDEFKLKGGVKVWADVEFPQEISYLSGREFLQRYGTESHRDIFGYDFWIDQLIDPPDAPDSWAWWRHSFGKADVCIVADTRFENEIERVDEVGGFNWKIKRTDVRSDGHASEKELPDSLFDLILFNDGSLDDLRDKTRQAFRNYL